MLGRARSCIIVSIRNEIDETEELCRTLDIEVIASIIQKKNRPDPHTFIGSGKIEEIRNLEKEYDIVVFDGDLTPSQHFRLETSIKKMCVDRIGLVLEIFDRHAGSAEAKAQISLAKIRYELPFLREWVSKSLSDDHPGFMAGGEYAIDAYYENARKQMKRIEKEIDKIAKEREARRSRRRRKGFFLVSICGYTNVGKSTLLNSLSSSETLVDDKLFSTLSTITRRLALPKSKILITDTVGFIKDLPPDLIDAFDATMEEIYVSDCVILLIDISDSINHIKMKLSASLNYLIPKVGKEKIILTFNKSDKISSSKINEKINQINQIYLGYVYYVISAKAKKDLESLIDEVYQRIGLLEQHKIIIPNNEQGRQLYHWISERIAITNADWTDQIRLELKLTEEEQKILEGKIAALKNKGE